MQWQERGIAVPSSSWLMQVASGNVTDVIDSIPLVPNGVLEYQQTVTGWAGFLIQFTETAAERLELSSLSYDPTAASAAALSYFRVTSVAANNRSIINLGAPNTNPQSARMLASGVARVTSNANTTDGAYVYEADGLVHPFLLVYNRTAGSIVLFTDREQITGTYDGTATNSTQKGFGGGTPPAGLIRFGAWWYGTTAETIGKDTLLRLGWPLAY